MAGRKAHRRIDELDARAVGERAENRGADAGHAEGEAEEEARDEADAVRDGSCAYTRIAEEAER